MRYKTKTIATLRTKTGSDAGKIQAGEEFDSNTDMTIRDALHRKIESGNYFGKYVPASACDAITAPPVEPTPDEPPANDNINVEVNRVDDVATVTVTGSPMAAVKVVVNGEVWEKIG